MFRHTLKGLVPCMIAVALLFGQCANNDGNPGSAGDSTNGGNNTPYGNPDVIPVSPYKDGGTEAVGSDPVSDGSAARLQLYGKEQYFWGDPGDGSSVPLVKIISSVTPKVVDVALAFNPGFLDLTYGDPSATNGWNANRPHTLRDIAVSDHVQIAFLNADGDTVMNIKLDLLSETALVSSGYASLGVLAGDGAVIVGDPKYILSYGTSMDDNFNMCGWTDVTKSPPTDSVYSANPAYPCYQYHAVYRVTLDPAVFGPSGFGAAYMEYVHASPAKTPNETITLEEMPGPEPGTPTDPFRFLPPSLVPPPDSTTPPDTSGGVD